jgi:high-affinity Fe2+/Pb2+ permease
MVIIGLVLIALGAVAIVLGVFTAELDGTTLKLAGIELSPMALFLVGVAAALVIWWGLWILKSGSKRSWARRKEQKRLEKLSEQLDTVDASRRMDVDKQEDEDRPTL